MAEKIKEHSAELRISKGKISKKLPVFYNPIMKLNRDIAILLLNSIKNKNMKIADILAGTGVRSIRFKKELKKSKIKSISINDNNKKAVQSIKNNIKLNKIKGIKVHNKDASEFLLESSGFDYIDIDPFGSPNSFLDASIKRLSRNGILAITATDTSTLSGSHPQACKRKYWAFALRNELMHETGIRILIRKIQLIASQYDKSLTPIFTHSTDHYMRVYFSCIKSKTKVDKTLSEHKYLLYCPKCMQRKISITNKDICCKKQMLFAGPLWTGQLWDKKLALKILKNTKKQDKELYKLISTIAKESKIPVPFFHDIHKLCKKTKKQAKKTQDIIQKIKKQGFKAAETHFKAASLRTNISIEKIKKLL